MTFPAAFRLFAWVLCFLVISEAAALAERSSPSDEKEWLACKEDSDCTSVILGCSYWQPVNKLHSDAMIEKYYRACRQSEPPGPQPRSSCVKSLCVNEPYTLSYWAHKDMDQNHYVVDRVFECFKEAGLSDEESSAVYDNEGGLLGRLIYDRINSLALDPLRQGEPLMDVIRSAASCQEIISQAKSVNAQNSPKRNE